MCVTSAGNLSGVFLLLWYEPGTRACVYVRVTAGSEAVFLLMWRCFFLSPGADHLSRSAQGTWVNFMVRLFYHLAQSVLFSCGNLVPAPSGPRLLWTPRGESSRSQTKIYRLNCFFFLWMKSSVCARVNFIHKKFNQACNGLQRSGLNHDAKTKQNICKFCNLNHIWSTVYWSSAADWEIIAPPKLCKHLGNIAKGVCLN